MEQQLENIVDHKVIYGVMVWPYFGQGYMGALLDRERNQIPGSIPWNPLPTMQEVIDSLERAAATLRIREGVSPHAITVVLGE